MLMRRTRYGTLVGICHVATSSYFAGNKRACEACEHRSEQMVLFVGVSFDHLQDCSTHTLLDWIGLLVN